MDGTRLLAGRYRLGDTVVGADQEWIAHDEAQPGQHVVATRVAEGDAADAAYPSARSTVQALEGAPDARLVRPVGVGVEDGALWVVRPAVDGIALSEVWAAAPFVARVGADAAAALAVAHRAGVTHGRIDEHAVVVRPDGTGALVGFTTASGDPADDVAALGRTLRDALDRSGGPVPQWIADAVAAMQADAATRPSAEDAGRLLQASGTPQPPITPTFAARASTPAPPPRRRLGELLTVGIAALLVLAGVAALLIVRPWETAGTSTAPPPTASAGLVGNVSTIDPCSLLDRATLQPFGPTTAVPDIGWYSTCGAEVASSTAGDVFFDVRIDAPTAYPPAGTPTRTGDITVYRRSGVQGNCDATIALPDRYRIIVEAAPDTTTADVCPMVDAGVRYAMSVITANRVGHHAVPVAPNSLLRTPACDLITPAAVSVAMPGIDTSVERGYNDWGCSFGLGDAALKGGWARLGYIRYRDVGGGTPIAPVGGRQAWTYPDKADAFCRLAVVQRRFPAADGATRYESFYIDLALDNGATPQAACAAATKLAAAAAPNLPAV